MSSDDQIRANRNNSRKSTGPKSRDGKATVARNAMKHGLTSNCALLPWENPDDFKFVGEGIESALAPVGILEETLVDRIVSLTWRLRRAGLIEAGLFAWRRYSDQLNQSSALANSYVTIQDQFAMKDLFPPKRIIADENAHAQALRGVADATLLLESEVAVAGRNYAASASDLDTLHRYEVGLEKSLFRTLREFHRVRASRTGHHVSVPLAIEMTPEVIPSRT